MCGIAGIISKININQSNLIKLMAEDLAHRGPDGEGYESAIISNGISKDKQISFAHKRLTIIDKSELGGQPMMSSDGDVTLTYNGEIYNYIEIKNDLIKRGYNFKSKSDTEVLLNAYIEYGENVFDKLIGMFAFAIFDKKNSVIILGRDIMGIKPIYYSYNNNRFVFASEQKSLLRVPDISRSANIANSYYYLRYGITDHGSGTMFYDINQVEPGTYIKMRLDLDNFSPKLIRYWTDYQSGQINNDKQRNISELKKIFFDNLKLHLRSDVDIGIALSGGIDSSAIALGTRHLNPDKEIHAFSFIADDQESSEEYWIDLVSKEANLITHKVKPSSNELIDDFEELIYYEDQPCGDFGIYPQHRVSKLAQKKGIKVLLSGEGGDEIFSGYTGFASAYIASLVCQCKFLEAVYFINKVKKLPGRENAKIEFLQYLLPVKFQNILRKLAKKEYYPSWLNKDWIKGEVGNIQPITVTKGRYKLSEALRIARNLSTLPHLLRYQDRASMSNSVESRVPFVSKPILNFANKIAENQHFSEEGIGKDILIKALDGIIPNKLAKRRDKKGFDLKRRKWIQGLDPIAQDLLNSNEAKNCSILNIEKSKYIWNSHKNINSKINSYPWRIISFLQWKKQYKIEI